VPLVAIALYRQAAFHSFDEEVNPFAGQPVLGNNTETAIDDLQEDVDFEPTVKRQWRPGIGVPCFDCLLAQFRDINTLNHQCLDIGVETIFEQLPPKARAAQVVNRDAVEQPHLIACAARADVESPFIRFFGKDPDAAPIIRRCHHRKKNHVALIALKRVCIAAYQLAQLHLLHADSVHE